VKEVFRDGRLYRPGGTLIAQEPLAPPKQGMKPHFELIREVKAPTGSIGGPLKNRGPEGIGAGKP